MRRMLVVALLLPGLAWGATKARPGTDEAEVRFAAARDAFRGGERVRLARLAESFKGHELAPWIEYWQLRLRLEEDVMDGVDDFLAREEGSYLAEKLRGDWLRRLGLRRDWAGFAAQYPLLQQPDLELNCLSWQARLARQDLSALDEARPYWFSTPDLPEACAPVVERLLVEGRLGSEDVWARLRLLLEAKRVGPAKQLLRALPAGQAPAAKSLEAAIDAPARYLTRLPADFARTRAGREPALAAVGRMARSDPAAAATQWRGLERRFPEPERAYAWGQIAWQAAQRHQPEALEWFGLAQGWALSDEQQAWKARALLRAGDWPQLSQAIGEMRGELAAQPVWTYWLGRALAAQGRIEEARQLYLKLGGQANFYGNLADEELGRFVSVPPRAVPPSREELAEAAANRSLRRALALLRTDLRVEGVREWSWGLRGLDDRQLLAAAELARREEVFDRAISAADRTRRQHDFGLRYLAPFRESVEPKARQLGLDPGWVYGLMRQESRFVMDARSSVGAKGLMQLMPTTARWVAKKIGLTDYHPGRVGELDTNVTLGTRYLKMVLDGLDDHPVLASAAYNAGPGRAQRWRGERPLEGAIYAETIPFVETRDYVKKVMSNAVYYAAMFEERPQSLKRRLGVVRPKGAAAGGWEQLP